MRGCAIGLATALALGGGVAAGEPLGTIAVVGESQCPTPTAVAVALGELLPDAQISLGAGAITARLGDEGRGYRVIVAGRERAFRDPGRRCDERAWAAAVFVALTVAPPSVSLPSLPEEPPDDASPEVPRRSPKPIDPPAAPSSPPPPTEPPRSSPVEAGRPAPALPAPLPAAPRRRIGVVLEAIASLDGAPRTAPDNSLLAGGGGLRLYVGATPLSVAVGAGGRSQVTLDVTGGTASVVRVPFDLDLRTAFRRGGFELAAELGFAATILFVGGQGFSQTESATRLELGLRIAGSLRRWFGPHVGLVVGIETWIAPRPFELTVSPAGVVGTTPQIWLSLFAGAVFRLH